MSVFNSQDIFLDVDIQKVGRRSIVRAACASTNNQLTDRIANEPTRPLFTKNGHKCLFWGNNMAVLGPNILIFQVGANVLVPTYQKKHLGTFFALFLVGHRTKWAKNANIWPKMKGNYP